MNQNSVPHISVLSKEIMEYIIKIQPKHAVDFTFGAGGHSKLFLEHSQCYLTALDRDPSTYKYGIILKEKYKERFNLHIDISTNMMQYFKEKQDFILGDLGISQMQLQSNRGFAYNKNSTLEMNMGINSLGKLNEILQTLTEQQIYNILMEYGEEPQSKQISKAIYLNRMKIKTSDDLKNIITTITKNVNYSNKTLSRCFQAFRIYINQEIDILHVTLNNAFNALNTNGVLAIITFHSLEDRATKIFFKHKFKKSILITPSEQEISINNQARSAKLRIGIKE